MGFVVFFKRIALVQYDFETHRTIKQFIYILYLFRVCIGTQWEAG
jgi:hypothetical protein